MEDHSLSSFADRSITLDETLNAIAAERERLGRSEHGARENMIRQARDLISLLETPQETISWITLAEPTRLFASRIALDLNLFQTLIENGGQPKTTVELAKPKSASSILVNRIARRLASMGMIQEIGPEEYAPNYLTYELAKPNHSGGIRFLYDSAGPSFVRMSEYLEKRKYENPKNATNGPFQFAHSSADAFSWLEENPKQLRAFHAWVHGQREDRPSWTSFYPVQERLTNDLKLEGDSSALVDVGGGTGQVLEEFNACVPNWKGRLVLEERPSVIDHARAVNVHQKIELRVHDFFQEQPVKGARAYYMRYILHDWGDESALTILGHLKDAMEPEYSRVLINEIVMADQGAAWQHTSLDLFMMALLTNYERTEQEWRDLIQRAGLKVGGIWSKGIGNESLIEVYL